MWSSLATAFYVIIAISSMFAAYTATKDGLIVEVRNMVTFCVFLIVLVFGIILWIKLSWIHILLVFADFFVFMVVGGFIIGKLHKLKKRDD